MPIINPATLSVIGALPQDLGLLVEGTNANDTLYGTPYDDGIYGRLGSDDLFGGNGNDILDGGSGNDFLIGGQGSDQLIGGDGIDTASYANATIGISLDLADRGFLGEATGDTFSSVENVFGSNYGDILIGNQLANLLRGAAGEDWLFGKAGNDVLDGGSGDDIIKGGSGNDILIGGLGRDTLTGNGDGGAGSDVDIFVLSPIYGAPDQITDFQNGIDKIGLYGYSGLVFSFTGSALAKGTSISPGYNVHHVGQLFYDTDDYRLLEVTAMHVGGFFEADTYTAKIIANFTPGVNLNYSDFVFVNADELTTVPRIGSLPQVALPDLANTLSTFEKQDDSAAFPSVATIMGTEGDNLIVATAGPELIDGGGGTDIVQYNIERAAAVISLNTDGSVQVDGGGIVGADILLNVEKVQFSDGALVYDIPQTDDAALVYRIYQAAFARSPDEAGFRFWQDQQEDHGLNFLDMAAAFRTSPEFTEKYGANVSDDNYVYSLYSNVLQRTPDANGLEFWQGVLNGDVMSRDELLLEFAQCAENVLLTKANIEDGYWLV